MAVEFPAFLKLAYQQDGSTRTAFVGDVARIGREGAQQFDKAFGAIEDAASRRFEGATREAKRQLDAALDSFRNGSAGLNLNPASAQASAAAATARATAARELAAATRQAAQEAGDFSQAARQSIAATEALAREEAEAAASARAHAAALEQVQSILNRQKTAVDATALATGRHASAMSRAANENGQYRASMINAGQQLQDFAIQVQGGQRVTTALTQQLPQLAYALSGLADSSNKTASRIGAVATALSGPLGVGVVIGVAALGSLAAEFFKSGDAVEKATKQTFDFTRGLDLLKLSATDAKDAMAQLAQEIRGAILVQGDFLQQQADIAKSSRVGLEDKLASAVASLEREKANIGRFTLNPVEGLNRADRIGKLQTSIAEYRKALDGARTAEAVAEIALSQQRIAESTDASTAAMGRFNREVGKLVTAYERAKKLRLEDPLADATNPGLITKAEFDRRMRQLTVEKDAAVAAARAAQRTSTSASLPAVTGSEVARLIGAPITSGFRTPAQNAAAKGAANSYHLSGQAIDIPLTVNGRPLTKEGIRAALEPAGIVIKELLGPGDKGHDDHFHVAFAKRRRGADQVAEAAQRASDHMARLGEFAADAAAKVDSIGQTFGETPTMIARANDAMAKLRDLADDVDQRLKQGLDPKIAKALTDEITRTLAIVADAPNRPFRDFVKAQEQRASMTDLLARGQGVEVETRERIISLEKDGNRLTVEQIEAIRQGVVAEKLQTAELDKQNALRQRNVALINETEANMRGTFQSLARGGGISSIGDGFKRQFDIIRTNAVDGLFDQLLGGAFTDARDKALGFDRVREASEDQAKVARATRDALDELRASAERTALSLAPQAVPTGPAGGSTFAQAFGPEFASWLGTGTTAPAVAAQIANDNPAPIVAAAMRSPRQVLGDLVGKVADAFVDPATAKRVGEGFANGLSSNASAFGMIGGGLVNGKGNSALGSAIGGALGEQLGGKLLGSGLKSISSSLGTLGGPLASILGGVLGGVLGGLLIKPKTGTATIGGVNGALGITGTGGNSQSRIRAASGAADTIISSMDRIAEALGGTIDTSRGAVSIGIRDKNYRVDPTGQGITRKSRGAINFGTDAEAAAKAATLDLLQDGVIAGIRASTQRLLSAGKDLDSALRKATDFESVFQQLKEIRDPVGAALDTLDRTFTRYKAIFTEAAATSEELADLTALYEHKRAAAVKEALERTTGSLQSLLSELNIGDSGLSLRSRLASAQAVYDPLKAKVQAGDVSAFDDYAKAAQDVLGLSRSLYGSQSSYFAIFEEIRTISQGAVDAQKAIADAAAGRDSPFSTSTVPTTDNAGVISAIDAQTSTLAAVLNAQLGAVNDNLGSILTRTGTGSGSIAGWQGNGYF